MTISTFAPDFDYNDVSKTLGVDKVDVLSASFEAVDGTAPFTVTSTTKVTNLNADKIDGLDSTAFLKVSNNLSDITNAGTARTNLVLGNVDNTSDAAKPISTAGQAALDLKAPLASPAFTGTVTGVTKTMVGLGNVDNTADTAKPVSTAAQAALDLKAPLASPTFTGTVTGVTKAMVGLGSVDNTSDAAKPVSTAAQAALDLKAPLASPTFTGTVTGVTKAMVGLGSVDNTSDAAKPVSTAAQAALDLKAPLASPTFTGTVTGVTKAMVGLGSVDNTSDAAKPVSTAAQAALDLKAPLASPAFTGTVTVPAPVNATDASTKGYVDAVKQGLDIKDSVRVASTANIAIATALINASTIDGVTVSTGDRVLLKNQSAPAENGIYIVVASGAASRSLDADVSADVTSGMYVFVSEGTANAGTGFVLITADPIVLGTTPISFTAFSGAGQVIAGNGLSESGNTLSIDTAVTADLSTAQTFTNKSISGGQITSAVANATLAATVTTNANLTGDVTSVGNATTLTNAPVISKVLTGYVAGAGTVAATDSILQAIQKVDGNDALRETLTNKDASGGYAGLTLLKLNLRNAANTITSFFTTAATVARTWTMPDKDGTVAMTSDITGINSGTNTGDQTTITGNAGTATALQTARTIGGTSFDGTANISISTVAATALTGTVDSARLSGAYSGVTGLGTLTALAVDNVSVDLNTIATTSGALNLTPLAGQDLKATLSGGGEFTIYGGETWWGDSSALGFLGYTGGMPILGSIGALALAMYTNGVERLRIDSSGNVGIGTSSPTSVLDVYGGDIYIRLPGASASTFRGIRFSSDTTGVGFVRANASTGELRTEAGFSGYGGFATFYTDGSERLRIDSSGNVGIGTTSPGATLEIATTGAASSVILRNTSAALNSYSEIKFAPFTGTTAASAAIRSMYYQTDASAIEFRTTNTNAEPATRVIIDGAGNVGIGTTSPNANALLDVTSTTKAFMPPRMTTTQKNAIASPTAGMIVYDSTLNKLSLYTTSWETVTSI